MPDTILTLQEFKARYPETGRTDAILLDLIGAATEDINTTELARRPSHRTRKGFMWDDRWPILLPAEAGEITAITRSDGSVLPATDYALTFNQIVDWLGDHSPQRGYDTFLVEFTPLGRTAIKRRCLIQLCQLVLTYTGNQQEHFIGSYQIIHTNFAEERAGILSQLQSGRSHIG